MVWSTGMSKVLRKSHYLFGTLLRRTVAAILWLPQKFQQVVVTTFISLADYFLDKARTAAQKAILLWLLLISLILVSILSYVAFYKAYVPTAEITRPVYLSFRVCSSGIGVCSYPTGNISFWNDEGTLQEFLGPGQAYSVMLTLEVPESPRNRNLGMFVVAVNMFDRHGIVSSTSERSAMLRYHSIITRLIDFIGWLPLYFLGFKEHKQTISMLMFPHFVDNYYHPSVGATVEIQSHGIEIYSCMLTLSAKFSGLKYYLYYWPITSAMCAFWSNLIVFALALGLTMYKRSSDMKTLAVTLDLVEGSRKKDGYEAEVKADPEDETDEEETSALTTSTSGAQTKSSDTNRDEANDADEDSDSFDIPVVQEPVDFIPEGEEDVVGIDFVTELRQRRIN